MFAQISMNLRKDRNSIAVFKNAELGEKFFSSHSLIKFFISSVGHLPDMRQTVGFWTQVFLRKPFYNLCAILQFKTLLSRSMLDNVRNTSLTRAKIIQKVIMGVFIGLLYLQTPLNMVCFTVALLIPFKFLTIKINVWNNI